MVKVKSLNIEIDGQELNLSIEKAEELYWALGKALNKSPVVQKEYAPYTPYLKDYWWQNPIVEPDTTRYFEVYCSNNLSLQAK